MLSSDIFASQIIDRSSGQAIPDVTEPTSPAIVQSLSDESRPSAEIRRGTRQGSKSSLYRLAVREMWLDGCLQDATATKLDSRPQDTRSVHFCPLHRPHPTLEVAQRHLAFAGMNRLMVPEARHTRRRVWCEMQVSDWRNDRPAENYRNPLPWRKARYDRAG